MKTTLDTAATKLIDTLMAELTLAQKCSLLSGKDNWATFAIPEKGIGSVLMTDGPHGVRADGEKDGRKVGPATYFPTGVGLAATWNPALLHRLGEALAEETLAYGCDILLGPCVNIVRAPLAGRNFESYGEDPFLAGRLGAAWINGIQSKGVGASLKHFACNNQETERMRGNSVVDERTLREIYLPQFEYAVKESRPWTVMSAYNRINGVYASQHEQLLTRILREEWGFEGLVVSDWGGNHTTVESVAAGLDLEMPGPALYTRLLPAAVQHWQIDEKHIDRAARKMLELAAKAGKLGKPKAKGKGAANTLAHQKLALEIAEESITLLKNDGNILPLNLKKIKTLALIGGAAQITPQGGGSSHVVSPYRVAPVEAFRRLLGDEVEIKYASGCSNDGRTPVPPISCFRTPDGKQAGILGEYFNNTTLSGKPVGSRIETAADIWWYGDTHGIPVAGLDFQAHSGRYRGKFHADYDGSYLIDIDVQGSAKVWIGGKLIVQTKPFSPAMDWETGKGLVEFKAGCDYDFKLEYVKAPANQPMHVRIGVGAISPEEGIAKAAELAASCDAVVVFAGFPDNFEAETSDRKDMKLPGEQDKLVAAVLKANPNAVVVINTGTPVEMPWADAARAILQGYYPGLEGGTALARIVLGKVNPSGKLTVSYSRRLEDNPSHLYFPGGREAIYGEGIFVGYRYYDKKKLAPLFPFGHGLSYTGFAYSKLTCPARAKAGSEVSVRFTVKNTGTRAGKEVVQLYVGDKVASVPRPEKELKGFAKIELAPGESRELVFALDARAFAFYDVLRHAWTVEPGEFEILAGSSSADIRIRATIELEGSIHR